MIIDWSRMAEPQPDFYDVTVLKELLKSNKNHEKIISNNPNCFLGHTSLEPYTGAVNPGRGQALPEHIRRVESKMFVWPELAESYKELIDFIIFAAECEPEQYNSRYGCACGHMFFDSHNFQYGKIGVFVSMLGTLGSLEALAHECGHLRLRMAGIHIEDHDNLLLLNGPDELFESPIRKDKPRPMSAVLQAQYSYVMVSMMDLKYYSAFPNDPKKQQCAVQYLKQNIPRISKGHDEVKRNIRLTVDGQHFMDGFWKFSDSVIEQGLALI